MPTQPQPEPGILLYQTEDGRTRIQCRLEDETIWLTQIQLAELFQTSVPNINLHLKAIYAEGELTEEATIKSYLIVRSEGPRQVTRPVLHYKLEAILAVGYRVRSHRGTQFRQWATARLAEYLIEGFAMDDERLKSPPGLGQTDYFDDLLARIRDIRSSERRFYQKVLDIYATSVDYTPNTEASQLFFATVQNKMHWALSPPVPGSIGGTLPALSCPPISPAPADWVTSSVHFAARSPRVGYPTSSRRSPRRQCPNPIADPKNEADARSSSRRVESHDPSRRGNAAG